MDAVIVARVQDQQPGSDCPWFEVWCRTDAGFLWAPADGEARLWHCTCRDGLAPYLQRGICRHLNAIFESGGVAVHVYPNVRAIVAVNTHHHLWGSYNVELTPEGEEIMHAHWACKRLGG